MYYKQKSKKNSWYQKDTRTITLGETFEDFDDFIVQSGIEDKEEYRNIFNLIYNLYNDNYTNWNTPSYLSQWLKYYIEIEYDKYSKINGIWDNEIESLTGKLSEINQFDIGDIYENIDDYDKYKSGRQTHIVRDDILDKIKQLQNNKSPIEKLVENIALKVFQQFEVLID